MAFSSPHLVPWPSMTAVAGQRLQERPRSREREAPAQEDRDMDGPRPASSPSVPAVPNTPSHVALFLLYFN